MSIRKRASKKAKSGYVYEVYFNYTNFYGIPSRYSKSGFTTKKEAQAHETDMKKELNENGFIKKNIKITLHEVYLEALEKDFPSLYQENTIDNMKRSYLRYAKDVLGNYDIRQINYGILQAFFKDQECYSLSTVKNIKKALNAILNYAMKCEYITSNPLHLIKVKGKEQDEKQKVYKESDFAVVINDLETIHKVHPGYIIALYIGKYTALRSSEAFALDWSDIDFSNNIIDVNKKLIYLDYKDLHAVSQMKNSASKSYIPLPLPLKEILLEWKKKNHHVHIVCDDTGYYLNPARLCSLLSQISKNNGFRFSYHMLRHTYATNLYNQQVDVKTIQSLLRHSSVNTTLDIYTHSDINSLSNTVNSVFNSESVEKVSKMKNQLN